MPCAPSVRSASGSLALPAAALLTLAGIPGYFALPAAVVTPAIAAFAFLAGPTDPLALPRRLRRVQCRCPRYRCLRYR